MRCLNCQCGFPVNDRGYEGMCLPCFTVRDDPAALARRQPELRQRAHTMAEATAFERTGMHRGDADFVLQEPNSLTPTEMLRDAAEWHVVYERNYAGFLDGLVAQSLEDAAALAKAA